MQITASYKVEILQLHTPLKKTLKIYREAVDWLLPVIDSEWDVISAQDGPKRQFNLAEHLIHKTKDNEPDYPFDEAFPNPDKPEKSCSENFAILRKISVIRA